MTIQNLKFLIFKWVVVLLIALGLAFVVYLLVKINQPLTTDRQEQLFTVPSGQTSKQVAQRLAQDGLISRAFFFDLYIFFKGHSGKLQAGDYLLSRGMSIAEIAETLVSGRAVSDAVQFTILPGRSLKDIVANNQLAGSQDFLELKASEFFDEFAFLGSNPAESNLEGFLFPDTYFIDRDTTAHEAARKILGNFDRKLTPELRAQISAQGKSIYETVTLASIIEREVGRNVKKGTRLSGQDLARLAQERRLVASVFKNRLEVGMALESDATISYITGNRSARATLAETQIDSPYNTYRYRGLPPGPIANPSLDAILAAINPADTDYLYFLTAPDGTAYFAKTFEEHQLNRQRYLE